jgi:hypothetical protein
MKAILLLIPWLLTCCALHAAEIPADLPPATSLSIKVFGSTEQPGKYPIFLFTAYTNNAAPAIITSTARDRDSLQTLFDEKVTGDQFAKIYDSFRTVFSSFSLVSKEPDLVRDGTSIEIAIHAGAKTVTVGYHRNYFKKSVEFKQLVSDLQKSHPGSVTTLIDLLDSK